MQAIGRQPQRAPDGSPLYYERHRAEQTTLCRLVQQHAASFIAHTEASTGAELPRFIKDEFDAFLECGILADGFLRLQCGDCGRDKLLAFSLPSGAGSARHAVRGPDARQLRARGRRAALHRAMSRNGGGALLRYADITPERVDDLSGGAKSDTRM
ncbi:MAG TPA: hypothetical protein PLO41_15725 [Rubrivivax sp.]|nr:hypothetical protein [Rubrivivax sp.]